MKRIVATAALVVAAGMGASAWIGGAPALVSSAVAADKAAAPTDPAFAKYIVGDKRSGYTFAEPETRSMQDDDFINTGFLWVEKGEALWSKVEGEAGKSCASCHGDAATGMKGVGATYPKFDEKKNTLLNLELRINNCRKENMKAEEYKYESEPLLSLTTYVKMQSRGMPVNVSIDGKAQEWFEKGKEFYYTRRGQQDMACKHCHEDNAGNMIRAELLSQGHTNGFPTYRLKWQKLGSLHRRFAGCNEEIRAEPYKAGGPEYLALELYTAWRANGLPVEAPSVRK